MRFLLAPLSSCVLAASVLWIALNSSNALAQTTTSSGVTQIVYAAEGSTLVTWDVNPQTFQATQAGTTTLPQTVYPGMLTSPDGHFLYYTAYANYSQQNYELYVYATNAAGVPQGAPVQQIEFSGMSNFVIDPTGQFAYAVLTGPAGSQTTPYSIIGYQRNSRTGQLGNPVTEATYNLSNSVGGLTCELGLLGFSPHGDQLYDLVYCFAPTGSSASYTYSARHVNPNNGSLAQDVEFYSWTNDNGGGELVQPVRNLFFDFVDPDPSIPEPTQVNVYPMQPHSSTPLIECTSSMQAACGSFIAPLAHPSGQYVFIYDSSYLTDILRVDVPNQQLTLTNSSIPYEVQQFSPDGSIAYAVYDDFEGELNIEIYGFNTSNAALTPGGTITLPTDSYPWYAAERYP